MVHIERREKETAWNKYTPPILKASRLQRCIARGFPTDDELRWLLRQGVNEKALWPISGATVRFDGGTFDVDQNGVRTLTFRCYDRGEVIDIAAWQPRTRQLASWRGQAFCLGDVDDIFNPAAYFAVRPARP